jgi:gamma-glutamylcyclotransferase (GGCT)/AIG2-like uncharacterized protein YtfP
MADYLFVYGTLLPGAGPAGLRALTARFRPVGLATVRGRLYDLGAYPAAVLDDPAGTIIGHLLEVPDDPVTWRALDEYEGCDPQDPAAGLYRRERCSAKLDDGRQVNCWVYAYNGRVDARQAIASGRWHVTHMERNTK